MCSVYSTMWAFKFRFLQGTSNPYFAVYVHLWYLCYENISLSQEWHLIPDRSDKHSFMWKKLFSLPGICQDHSASRFCWTDYSVSIMTLFESHPNMSTSWNIWQILIKKTIFVSQPEGTHSAIFWNKCDWIYLFKHEKQAASLFNKHDDCSIFSQIVYTVPTSVMSVPCTCLDTSRWTFAKHVSCLPWPAQLISHQKLQIFETSS